MPTMLQKYADLLIHYCLEITEGDRLYVNTTTLAEPLVRELYRSCLKAGGHMEVGFKFREQNRILYQEGSNEQLSYLDSGYCNALKNFDAYLYIRAPYNLKEDQNIDQSRSKIRRAATKDISAIYNDRTATRSLRRSLCQYPTQANAQEADMSLEEYEHFVFSACKLYEDEPIKEWKKLGQNQQAIVDMLNSKNKVRYVNQLTDIEFSVQDRIWINSDGKTNMPSGEVFSGPVEDSVNGTVHFDYPSIYMGKNVSGITLEVKNGKVEKWSAKVGGDVLDKVFAIEGARYFGEVAIGTNYSIQQATKNILFDEKIGGSVHMAVGQSYKQTGGLNESSVHWDMISSMTNGGQIFADDVLIYQDGKFLEFKV